MKELGPEARALVDTARDADQPTADDRRRVRRALTAMLTGGAAGAAAPTAAAGTGVAAAAQSGAVVVAKKVLVVAAVTGAVGGGAVVTGLWEPTPPTASAPAAVTAPSETDATVPSEGPPAEARLPPRGRPEPEKAPFVDPSPEARDPAPDTAPSPAPSPEEVPAAPAPADAPARGSSSSPSQASSRAPVPVGPLGPSSTTPGSGSEPDLSSGAALSEEIALLREAHRALRAGDGATALAAVETHLTRFPEGALRTEAEAAQVLALCALGRTGAASRVGRRFLERAPASPLAGKVRGSCAFGDPTEQADDTD